MVEAWATFYTHVQHYKRSFVSARQFLPGGGKLRDNSDGNSDGFHIETAEDMYHVVYIEAIDLAISTIQDRFNQPEYAMYRYMENLLLKADCGEEQCSLWLMTTIFTSSLCR